MTTRFAVTRTGRERARLRRMAGTRARARYRELHRRWLRRNRGLWVRFALAAAGFVVVAHLLAWWLEGDQRWAAGFLTGIASTVWIALRQSPPTGVAQWQEGAWGEEMTADELDALSGRGWHVVHDLARSRGNIDHVVVGPAGVFVLDSKKSSSRLVVDRHVGLRTSAPDDEDGHGGLNHAMLPSLRAQARHVRDLLAAGEQCVPVRPVLVWWGRYDGPAREVHGVLVVHGSGLVRLLEAQPRGAAVDVERVAGAVAGASSTAA